MTGDKVMDFFLDFGLEGRIVGVEELGRELLEGFWEYGEEEREEKRR